MATLSKVAVGLSAARSSRISDLAIVTIFSLIGLMVALLAARYGIEIGDTM